MKNSVSPYLHIKFNRVKCLQKTFSTKDWSVQKEEKQNRHNLRLRGKQKFQRNERKRGGIERKNFELHGCEVSFVC